MPLTAFSGKWGSGALLFPVESGFLRDGQDIVQLGGHLWVQLAGSSGVCQLRFERLILPNARGQLPKPTSEERQFKVRGVRHPCLT